MVTETTTTVTANSPAAEEWSKKIRLIRILNDDHETKFVAIEGEIQDENDEKICHPAVLIMEKTPFQLEEVAALLKGDEQQFKVDFINDVYHKYMLAARSTCNDVKLTFIYPASPLHIKKYSKKELRLVSETPNLYKTIVEPYIEKNQLNAQWVLNILDGKSERDRILFQTDDFIILPDIMWDGKALESLHVLALVKQRNIRSIRDLTPEHLPMLKIVLEQTMKFLSDKYNLPDTNVRAFFHYPPTFYHLHVHFTTLQNRACGSEVERARLLQDAIDHLQLQNDYYQKKTLYYKVATNDPLYKLLENEQQTSQINK